MSKPSSALALMPSMETLDHFNRYLNTWGGSDKFFMVVQYAAKLLVPLLRIRAGLQHRAGLRGNPASDASLRFAKLASVISDARTLWRIWGLLPIISWAINLRHTNPVNRRLQAIEQMQAASMLVFYPVEAFTYLCNKDILPKSFSFNLFAGLEAKPTPVNTEALGMLTTRLTAVFVALQLGHLHESRKLMIMRERNLRKAGKVVAFAEKEEIKKRWAEFYIKLTSSATMLPLLVNWSFETGFIQSDIVIATLGLVSAVAGFTSGWRATALPPVEVVPSLVGDLDEKDSSDIQMSSNLTVTAEST